LHTLTVSLLLLDRSTNKIEPLGDDFQVRNDAGKLAEMNESFLLRGLFDDGQAVLTAAGVAGAKVRHPLLQPARPVTLEVLYDGRPVSVEHREGRAFIPEPQEGQKVAFRLRRDDSKIRLGVVLK